MKATVCKIEGAVVSLHIILKDYLENEILISFLGEIFEFEIKFFTKKDEYLRNHKVKEIEVDDSLFEEIIEFYKSKKEIFLKMKEAFSL